MSPEIKAASMFFALAVVVGVWLFSMTVVRWWVYSSTAKGVHDFYVTATGEQPTCETCPFNRKCPYARGKQCRYAVENWRKMDAIKEQPNV